MKALLFILFLLPFALWDWTWPSAAQWAILFVCGIFGSLGHYFSTRALRAGTVTVGPLTVASV